MSAWGRDAWSKLAPYVEPAMTVASSMAADIPAGIAGLEELITGQDPERAAATVQAMQDRFTYLPRSEAGQENLGKVAEGIDWVGQQAGKLAEAATGTPTPFADTASWVNGRFGPGAATALFMAPEAVGSAMGFRAGQAARAARRGARALPAIAADIPRLPHAQQVRGVHFGNAPDLTELDPGMYGRGARGAEAGRLMGKKAEDIRPRSYFYLDDRQRGESGTGAHRYEAELQDVYDLTADPLGIRGQMRARFTTPPEAQINPGMVDWEAVQNETERFLKAQGYGGYMTPGGQLPAAVMWGKTPVRPAPWGGSAR